MPKAPRPPVVLRLTFNEDVSVQASFPAAQGEKLLKQLTKGVLAVNTMIGADILVVEEVA